MFASVIYGRRRSEAIERARRDRESFEMENWHEVCELVELLERAGWNDARGWHEEPDRAECWPAPDVTRMVATFTRCPWPTLILNLVRTGAYHLPELRQRAIGMSEKALDEWLCLLTDFALLCPVRFSECGRPLKYRLTRFGDGFLKITDAVEQLQQEAIVRGVRVRHV